MSKQTLSTDKAPGAIGPYAQGILAGSLIFTSGQLPIDMQTGLLETDDIKKAVRHALDNLRAILQAAGADREHIVKTTVFLTDLADFAAANEAYAAFFPDAPPARSCVQVAALPKNARVEIEAIAIL
ncbi:MAG: Rid family detoxifying hydrolase [Oscillospiraceae bacterium]|jgi:2-iminobutanoate/2-iminopropanoate deaminase|nr:Rid family detoxifying hydrolase [Oscillospiraceae bacterium]